MGRTLRLVPDDPDIGWIPHAWLLYVGFVFLTPILGEMEGARIWWASAIATALFLPLYFAAYWVEGRRRFALAVLMALVGSALAPVNPGASTFFAYAAYFAGLSHDQPRRASVAVGVIFGLALLTGLVANPTVFFVAPALLGIIVLGPLGTHFAVRQLQTAELRMARAEVEGLARIAERDRIAGDLHDLLGHTLSVIILKSELVQALAPKHPERARAEAGEIHDIARQALAEVRTAVQGYRVGGGGGLRHELDGIERALEAGGIALTLEGRPEALASHLDAAHEGVLALAIREAVTNVIRHARASRCWVSFLSEGGRYGVEVRDDGKGFSGSRGHGLRGMRSRVESLGGVMALGSGDGGTRLSLSFADAGDAPLREVSA